MYKLNVYAYVNKLVFPFFPLYLVKKNGIIYVLLAPETCTPTEQK